MNKINYDKNLSDFLEKLKASNEKPKLLLHACCAPCSTTAIERLKDYFSITVFFYNPNIDTEEEFTKRQDEQARLLSYYKIDVIKQGHNKQEFLDNVKGLEALKEGGARCEKCFSLRLGKTAKKAKELGFEYFATTLTLSPLKNAGKINEIGKVLEKEFGVKYLATDFKKQGGYLKSIELSKKYGLYRQNYCGCEFSKR